MITAKLKRRARTITGFFVGQGALQTLNAFTNFLLLHLLSVEAYAQFGLAFGFQLTADALTNFGFASTIITLVGDRAKDGVLVGTYVRAAKRLSNVSFLIIAPFCAIAFLFVVHDRPLEHARATRPAGLHSAFHLFKRPCLLFLRTALFKRASQAILYPANTRKRRPAALLRIDLPCRLDVLMDRRSCYCARHHS